MTKRTWERLRRWVWLVSVLAAAACGAPTAWADGLIIVVPPPHPTPMPMPIRLPPRIAYFPLRVVNHDVTVTVKGQVATTEVDQVFHNPNPRDLEGTYMFPVPEGASVSALSLWMGGKEVRAELLDAGKARQVYEEIVRKMRDPALLEYAGRRMFRARVYPIPARGDVRVKIRYEEVLHADGGLVELRYPLNTEKFSSAPLEHVKVAVRLGGEVGTVFSPSHPLRIERSSGKTEAVYVGRGVTPDRDFVLYYQKPEKDRLLGMSLLTNREAGQTKGTFLLLLSPKVEAKPVRPAKDVVFVVDRSGSMAGAKLQQAKRALRYCLRSLGPDDRLQLIDFGTGVESFRADLSARTDETLRAAETYVDELRARGGTDLHGAVVRALENGLAGPYADESGAERPLMLVVLTDGEPTIGVTDAKKIEAQVKKARDRRPDGRRIRLHVLGIGSDLNAELLDRLAEANRGTRGYIGERESIEAKVSSFFDRVSYPVLSDVTLRVDGVRVREVYPRPIPDLFYGGEVAILGEYEGDGPAAIRVGGRFAGRNVEVVYEGRFGKTEAAPFLPRALAVRKVGYLLDQIRLHGDKKELRSEVVRLAKRFGIVTPYTSFLVTEDAEISRASGGRRDAAANAIRRLRGASGSLRRAEREARGGLGRGWAGKAGAPAPEGYTRTAASEALRKLRGGQVAPASPAASGADAAKAPLLPQAGELLAGTLVEAERFKKAGDMALFAGQKARSAHAAAQAGRELRRVLRIVSGRAFYRDGEVWVDSRVAGRAVTEKVEYLSAGYFALAKLSGATGRILALGPRVRFTIGARVIEVVPAAK